MPTPIPSSQPCPSVNNDADASPTLSGFTVGVFWPPWPTGVVSKDWNKKREDDLLRLGAKVVHIYLSDDQCTTKNDFNSWWNGTNEKAQADGSKLIVLKDNDWLQHLVSPQSKLCREWLNEDGCIGNFNVQFVHWRNIKLTYEKYIPKKQLLSSVTSIDTPQNASEGSLSGYTVGVYWPPNTSTITYDYKFMACGANVLHLCPPSGQIIAKEDFLRWWNDKVRTISSSGSVLVVADMIHASTLKHDIIINWLKQKEEEEWFGDGRNEHLHVRFVTLSKLKRAMRGKPLVDSWSEVVKKKKVV